MTKTVLKGQPRPSDLGRTSFADSNTTVTLIGELARSSNQQSIVASEEAIRGLAHSKWEAAGCPVGDGIEFWLEAEREVNADQAGASSVQG